MDASVSVPKGGIGGGLGLSGDIDGPKGDIGEDVDLKGKPDAGGSFGIKMPKFGFGGGNKGKGDIDADVGVSGGIGASIEGDLGGGVDVNPEVNQTSKNWIRTKCGILIPVDVKDN